MKYNIIFLDVDGVLNNHQFITYNQNFKSGLPRNIDINKVILLKEIINQTNAKIVLSSSWRKMFDQLLQPITAGGIELKMVLEEYEMQIWDKTDINLNKVDSIVKWLCQHNYLIKNYIIIDDDYIWTEKIDISCLVKTSYYIGLSDKEVLLAVKRLNNIAE